MNTMRATLRGWLAALVISALGWVIFTGIPPEKVAGRGLREVVCWTDFSSFISPDDVRGLNDVKAISADDVWAVGDGPDGRAATIHWDGSTWRLVPNPGVGVLKAIAATSSDDVWAVGSSVAGQFPNEYGKALIMHWDGSEWSIVNGPPVGYLNGVAAVSSNDVWIVGDTGRGRNGGNIIILHWDGNQWTHMDTSGIRTTLYLEDVVAITKDNVWAAGGAILHWNGVSWTKVSTGSTNLFSLAAVGANDIWAVGVRRGPQVMRWDGATWTNIRITDTVSLASDWLIDVSASSADNAWAVSFGKDILHWGGSSWLELSNSDALDYRNYSAVTQIEKDTWIVGFQMEGVEQGARSKSVILRHTSATGAPCGPPPQWIQLPLAPPVPLPGSGSLAFPETGKSITGVFLDYWQKNGGLPQQGYPISDVIGDVSDLDRKVYTVQYFERAVFEYHPEFAGTPGEVLLSQLGTFQYGKKYPYGAPNQKPNNDPGSVLFRETGKRLGGRFLEYWHTHGGIPQQGYPISDEFTEVSDLNGKPYLVQYFERAVFEYHPENQPPNDVLLSQLGTFRYKQKYGAR